MANLWALKYAKQQAADSDAQVILLGLILAAETVKPGDPPHGLETAALAAQALADRHPQAPGALLRPILASPKSDPLYTRAILRGLARCAKNHAAGAVEGIGPLPDMANNNLATLVLAKHGYPLSSQQRQDLERMVRGGGGLDGALRAQAAWAYLKQTQQAQPALSQALTQ